MLKYTQGSTFKPYSKEMAIKRAKLMADSKPAYLSS